MTTILMAITVLTLSGVPIHEAGVFCDNELNVTDSHGRIVFDVEPGTHWIKVHKAGCQEAEGRVTVSKDRPDVVVRLDCAQ